jgi:drug/metabolite transporter (DMT)-like permease
MWVYVLSLSCFVPLIVREKFNWVKALMIFVSLAGFTLIALQDIKNGSTEKKD